MAFAIANFRMIGGGGNTGNQKDGGQAYSHFSADDTLATMLASGYFDDLASKLNVRDSILLCGSDFNVLARVASITAGVVVLSINNYTSAIQSLSGAGAIDIVTEVTEVTSTGADAITLVDGAIGQRKTITLIVDGGTATLTPTTGNGYSTIAFADAGDSVDLLMGTLGWIMTGHGGLSGGPVAS